MGDVTVDGGGNRAGAVVRGAWARRPSSVARFGVCHQRSGEPVEDGRWGEQERREMLDLHPGRPRGAVLKWGLAWKQVNQVSVTLVQEKCGDGLDQVMA